MGVAWFTAEGEGGEAGCSIFERGRGLVIQNSMRSEWGGRLRNGLLQYCFIQVHLDQNIKKIQKIMQLAKSS